MTQGPDIPADPRLSRAARAFLRRIRDALRGDRDPRYAIVVMDCDDEEGPYVPTLVLHANRTDAVYAAGQLLAAAVQMEQDQRCPCPSCDAASLKARAALKALDMEFELEGRLQ